MPDKRYPRVTVCVDGDSLVIHFPLGSGETYEEQLKIWQVIHCPIRALLKYLSRPDMK